MAMTTILGAGGAISNELAKILAARRMPFRLVGRNPKPFGGAEVSAADLSDQEQTIKAVAGSTVVHLLVGLKYDVRVWRELWPRIMANTIEACKRAQARLVFFDNVYMYGRVQGPMTEETPYAPCSKKGEVRAQIATMLMKEVKAGAATAMIARSGDFYGPDTRNGVPNLLVFEPLARGKKASWLVDARVPHSLTFTPDAARGVDTLANSESAWRRDTVYWGGRCCAWQAGSTPWCVSLTRCSTKVIAPIYSTRPSSRRRLGSPELPTRTEYESSPSPTRRGLPEGRARRKSAAVDQF